MSFTREFECPEGKDTSKEKTCKGCRVDGTLKYVCAACCSAYKKYVKQNV